MAEPTDCIYLLCAFASLHWYKETIKFVFTFVTKTSELPLAAGIVIRTANFLIDGDVMSHHKALSDAWAQVLAIGSSLGIVFMNAFQISNGNYRYDADNSTGSRSATSSKPYFKG